MLGLCLAEEPKEQTRYDAGEPTAEEQYVLQVINRGRSDPGAEGKRLNVDLAESLNRQEKARLEPLPPLAMNAKLLELARAHSKDMYDRSYFDHTTPEGKRMYERLAAGGYDYTTVAENLAGGAKHSAAQLHDILVIDAETEDRGHRKNLFGLEKDTANLREIGVGVFAAKEKNKDGVDLLLTQEFGTPHRPRVLLCGVVYADENKNGSYDPGEGLAGVTIKPDRGDYYAVTSASGGFTLPVPLGRVTLTVSGGKFEGTATASIKVTGDNIEVDFISGKEQPVVNFGKAEK